MNHASGSNWSGASRRRQFAGRRERRRGGGTGPAGFGGARVAGSPRRRERELDVRLAGLLVTHDLAPRRCSSPMRS